MVISLILPVKVVTESVNNTLNRFPSVKLSQIHTSLMFISQMVKKYDSFNFSAIHTIMLITAN